MARESKVWLVFSPSATTASIRPGRFGPGEMVAEQVSGREALASIRPGRFGPGERSATVAAGARYGASIRPGRFGPGESVVRNPLRNHAESERIRAGPEATAIRGFEGAVDGAELSNIQFPIKDLHPMRAGPGNLPVLNRSQAGGASVFCCAVGNTSSVRVLSQPICPVLERLWKGGSTCPAGRRARRGGVLATVGHGRSPSVTPWRHAGSLRPGATRRRRPGARVRPGRAEPSRAARASPVRSP